MEVSEFAARLDMRILTGDTGLDRKVTGIYSGDLLSWVMSHAKSGDAWITVHTHLNIIAVAVLTEVPCIIIPEGIQVEAATIDRAGQEGVAMLSTDMTVYEICCKAKEQLTIKKQ